VKTVLEEYADANITKSAASRVRSILARKAKDWASFSPSTRAQMKKLLPKDYNYRKMVGRTAKRRPTLLELYEEGQLKMPDMLDFDRSQAAILRADKMLTAAGQNAPRYMTTGTENLVLRLPNKNVLKIGKGPLHKTRAFDVPTFSSGTDWRIQPYYRPGILGKGGTVNKSDMWRLIRGSRKQGYIPHDVSGLRYDQLGRDPATGAIKLLDPNAVVSKAMQPHTGTVPVSSIRNLVDDVYGVPVQEADKHMKAILDKWRSTRPTPAGITV